MDDLLLIEDERLSPIRHGDGDDVLETRRAGVKICIPTLGDIKLDAIEGGEGRVS